LNTASSTTVTKVSIAETLKQRVCDGSAASPIVIAMIG
jgi:hypothetical protein